MFCWRQSWTRMAPPELTLNMDNQYSGVVDLSRGWTSGQARNPVERQYLTSSSGNGRTKGGRQQDKFLFAAVSHPMARRVAVRSILNEDRARFDRVKGFLDRQLENIS